MSKTNPAYPWADNPRVFRAVAMPNGYARFGVAGQLVMLCEQRRQSPDGLRFLSRAEAEQLRDEIDAALRAFDIAKDLARGVACRSPYPFRDHRTLPEVESASADGAAEAA